MPKPIVVAVDVARPLEETIRRSLSAEALPVWFEGSRVEHVDASWPARGARMRWRMRWGAFDATVVEDRLPAKLLVTVKTPSAFSQITWRFSALPGKGTRIEREVDPQYRGVGKLLAVLFHPILRRMVRAEQERLRAWLDGNTRSA